jgi:ATP-binding protein involved in chromosome partitioning
MGKQNQNNVLQEIKLENVKHTLLISSGKGGVGKSTIAANLAISLSREGYKTGLLDADLYGPSIPIMFDIEEERPKAKKQDDTDIMIPIEKYGVKIMSIGFLMNKEDAVIWRGPMASNALSQLITYTDWGELDYLIVDMPPGTGDINITLAQKLKQSKAMVVISPQKLAVADGLKAANMFSNKALNIPVIGVTENMSCFVPAKHPDEKYYIFGNGGGQNLADKIQTDLLGQIPLIQDVNEYTNKGKNLFDVESNGLVEPFKELAQAVVKKLD